MKKTVLSGSYDRTLRLWDLAGGESHVPIGRTAGTLRRLAGHMSTVTALAVLPDGRALSGSSDCTLRLWDLASGSMSGMVREAIDKYLLKRASGK